MTKFKIGDKVRVIKKRGNVEVGMKGTIVVMDKSALPIGVEFEKEFEGGHSLLGKCKEGFGYWLDSEELELVSQFENLIISCPTEGKCEEVRQELLRRGYRGSCEKKLFFPYCSEGGFAFRTDESGDVNHAPFDWYKEQEEPKYKCLKFLSSSEFLGNCTTCSKGLGVNSGNIMQLFEKAKTALGGNGIIFYPPTPVDYTFQLYGDETVDYYKHKKKNIMSNIIDFVKEKALTAEERSLRKAGLKDECGNYTPEAYSLVALKNVKENEAYLVEIAKEKEAADKEAKK